MQKNHYTYTGFAENIGAKNITSYLPYIYFTQHDDSSDTNDSNTILDKLDGYDLILFTPRSFIDPNFNEILNSNTSVTKIFLDNEDDFFIRRIYNHRQIKFYYKRELYSAIEPRCTAEWLFRYLYGAYIFEPIHDRVSLIRSWHPLALPFKVAVKSSKLKKLYSYPITIKPKNLPEMKRVNDLFFCMPLKNISDRKTYYKATVALKDGFNKSKIVAKTGGLSKDVYLENLKSAKCSVAVRGGGYDSDRYWEVPCYGSALLAQRTPLAIENNFVDEESALMFGSKEELRLKFKKYVLDSNEWKEIAKKGQRLYFTHHTPKKRIKELILNRL